MRRLVFALLLTSAAAVQAARVDGPPGRVDRDEQRRWVLQHMRIAAADRLIEREDEIAAYIAAQFNTLVLYDTEDGLLKSEDRIAYEMRFARSHAMHVLLGKATESVNAARHSGRTFALTATSEVSDEEIRDRLSLWDEYGHDEIVGVFFLHDDAFLIRADVERQRHLYALSHDVVPEWPVFGMIGGGGIDASPQDVARYYDREAFDHLIVILYPFNLAISIFDDVNAYIDDYVGKIGERFIAQLKPGQLVLLVIQAFAYESESAAHVPLGSSITAEAAAATAALQKIDGQQRNASLAYFLWDGSRAGMVGLWQRPDWIDAAQQVNDSLARDGGIEVRDGGPKN